MEETVALDQERPSGAWTNCASALTICFSDWDGDAVLGEIWSFYEKEPRPFRGLDQMLFAVEAALDAAGRQMAWCRPRTLEEQGPDALPVPMEPCWRPGDMLVRRGRLCTAVVRVYYRRGASMQGELRLGSRPESIQFRSGLELMHLIWSALGGQ